MTDDGVAASLGRLIELDQDGPFSRDTAAEAISIALVVPTDEWNWRAATAFAHIVAGRLDEAPGRADNYTEWAHSLLLQTESEGQSESAWNETMANVCFNLQLYEDATEYQAQVVRLGGGDPDQPLDGLYERVIASLDPESESCLTDLEILALYSHYG